jgi:hypothetical protein
MELKTQYRKKKAPRKISKHKKGKKEPNQTRRNPTALCIPSVQQKNSSITLPTCTPAKDKPNRYIRGLHICVSSWATSDICTTCETERMTEVRKGKKTVAQVKERNESPK